MSSVGIGRRALRHQYRLHAASSSSRSDQRSLSADQIIQELRPKLGRVMGVNAYMQNPPVIRVGGAQSKSLYQYTLQDTDQDELQQTATKLLNALQHAPGFADVTTDMDFTSPSVEVEIDRDQAAAMAFRSLPSKPRWARPSAASRFPPSMPATPNIG